LIGWSALSTLLSALVFLLGKCVGVETAGYWHKIVIGRQRNTWGLLTQRTEAKSTCNGPNRSGVWVCQFPFAAND
jgi:hypothetical protein